MGKYQTVESCLTHLATSHLRSSTVDGAGHSKEYLREQEAEGSNPFAPTNYKLNGQCDLRKTSDSSHCPFFLFI